MLRNCVGYAFSERERESVTYRCYFTPSFVFLQAAYIFLTVCDTSIDDVLIIISGITVKLRVSVTLMH